MKLFVALILVASLGCVSLGDSPRQKAAAVTNITLGAPFYAASYVSGLFLNFIAYGTAWIAGDSDAEVVAWFSADYGPDYASMNTPWCWIYMGREPVDRKVAWGLRPNTHIRQIPIAGFDTEWPPDFTWCRTEVGLRYNKRGDESFPLDPETGIEIYDVH
jgi:hypothetical protein